VAKIKSLEEMFKLIHGKFDKDIWKKAYSYLDQYHPWSLLKKKELSKDASPRPLNSLTPVERTAEKNFLVDSGIMLELGSHWGRFCFYKASNYKMKIIGTDASKIAVDTVNSWNRENLKLDIDFKVMLAEDIEFDDNFFDVVYAFETLEHVGDLDRSLKEISRVLKPSSPLIFSLPLLDYADGGCHTQKHPLDFWENKFAQYFMIDKIIHEIENHIIVGRVLKDK